MSPWYALLMVAGIGASAVMWRRIQGDRPALLAAYFGGLVGALVGAKVGFVVAELPWLLQRPDAWHEVLYGKTILGGLFGGYAGVELGKKIVGHREATGDVFARIIPVGLVAGRLGCALHGCCLGTQVREHWWAMHDAEGVPRVPSTVIEALFHLACTATAWRLERRGVLRGQLFHAYLVAYGLFRFVTEFWRDTPRFGFGLSPYQLLAVALAAFAAWRFRVRALAPRASS